MPLLLLKIKVMIITKYLDDAFAHVYQQRKSKTERDEIWLYSHNWIDHRNEIEYKILNNAYILNPCKTFMYKENKFLHYFSVQDQIVLKAISLMLFEVLPRHLCCYSYRGHGGVAAVHRKVLGHDNYQYVLKTDVKDYYASIDHYMLILKLYEYIREPYLLRIIYQLLNRVNERYYSYNVGIPRGASLSHLLGNFYLHSLDEVFSSRYSQKYFRYMDDILVLTQTKGALRRADKTIKQKLSRLKLTVSYRKTYIGKNKGNIVFLGKDISVVKNGNS
ncbi:hypothetical protein A9D46_18005 [Photobacterium damselae subsp. damselae]|uniref:reverse transcriptase domain-containing protein n=1 Tax=Photobacterium damselae TaxID=38293 RepID=UPI00084AE8B4|nr:reverse transcriptase domain-containing protein [Photobacterium damselae]OEC81425.1 hypothetical protein A9D46_18005 [Photobacterium damselae subsp. damselae]